VFRFWAPITFVPGVSALLGLIYKPRPGERQKLEFRFRTLHKWRPVSYCPSDASLYAFFGTRDHYRRSGVVSLRAWRKHFGEGTYAIYDGSHFMEEQYVRTLLADRLCGLAEGSCEV
jgi:hypothetical protein